MKKIKVTKNGPYEVTGNTPLSEEKVIVDKDGYPINWQKTKSYPNQENFALCRCGKSKNMPFCDGSHIKQKFDGTEAESAKKKYVEMEEVYEGQMMDLHDAGELCVGAGFCDRAGGAWELSASSSKSETDVAKEQCCNCPSGRLALMDKKGNAIEPEFKESISVVQEPEIGLSGPLWVKGGVEIESVDGELYEKRNRATLCRCGKSNNKPFCDGTHHLVNFSDEN